MIYFGCFIPNNNIFTINFVEIISLPEQIGDCVIEIITRGNINVDGDILIDITGPTDGHAF